MMHHIGDVVTLRSTHGAIVTGYLVAIGRGYMMLSVPNRGTVLAESDVWSLV